MRFLRQFVKIRVFFQALCVMKRSWWRLYFGCISFTSYSGIVWKYDQKKYKNLCVLDDLRANCQSNENETECTLVADENWPVFFQYPVSDVSSASPSSFALTKG